MNAIRKAVDDCKYRIPPQILKEVFTAKTYSWRDSPISIDERIINEVIKSRVLVDCSLVGGTEAMLPLDGLPMERVNNYTVVFHIPKTMTDGRSIMSVHSVSFNTPGMLSANASQVNSKPGSNSPVMMAGAGVMQSNSLIPVMSSASVQLIAENTIMVRDTTTVLGTGFLRCVLGHDSEMSHIQLRSIVQFCDLVVLALKSYIYNEMIIRIGEAQLSGGQDLGKFKEIVESYADSEEMYREYLMKTWSAVDFMNDRESYTRYIKLQLGSFR
jgi:hypothetical protein